MTVSPNVDEQAYVKQMRNVDPTYLPLYNPNPWSEDHLCVGDVGVIQAGTFRPLFNITTKATHRRNGGGVPENFEILPFSPSSDTYTISDPTVIKKLHPCTGDPRVTWSREDGPAADVVQCSPEDNEARRDKEYSCFSYKLDKASPDTSYVLLAVSDVEETVVNETQMEVWRHYMEKHHKYWLKYIRKQWLDPNFKAENLVLLCGIVKTSSWVIATLPKEGLYRLDIQDTPVGIQPVLSQGGKVLEKGVRYGQDIVEGHRELMQHFAQLAGWDVPDTRQPIRKRCPFIKGLRMEKDFWLPKRIVAAAEPQDPHSEDGDNFELFSSPNLASGPRCNRIHVESRFPSRCSSKATQQAVWHPEALKITFPAHSPTRSFSPLTIRLGYPYCHLHYPSLTPETSLPNIILPVAF